MQRPRLVLASGSRTRAGLLQAAGIPFTQDSAAVDEAAVKEAARAQGLTIETTAEMLAALKAERISARHPGALVLGADQMLDCGGDWFDKPEDREDAARQLRRLRGRSHRLVSAAVLIRDGQRIWQAVESAVLVMRDFSEAFLAAHLDRLGSQVTASVGGYQVEGSSVQLFARIQGEFSVILGLPIPALCQILRAQGVLET